MKSLYLRIWLTVVAVMAAFALISGWFVQRHLEQERARFETVQSERLAAWGDLVQHSLPGPDAPAAEQAAAVREWSQRLRLPMALDDERGQRLVTSESYLRREAELGRRGQPIRLDDGRTLWVMRPGPPRAFAAGERPMLALREAGAMPPRPGIGDPARRPWYLLPPGSSGVGLLLLLALLFVAIALGAYPVVRRLTRRLEGLQRGVEVFGAGALGHRVDASGRDEVAALAGSFNRAAERIESLVRSHQSLLANASHELRSPLARLKMAVAMAEQATPEQRAALRREIDANIAELDTLVDEVLLASRLDAGALPDAHDSVELLAIAAEESARVDGSVQGRSCTVRGDEKLLRRALRNLLENARRYGAGEIETSVDRTPRGEVEVRVCDRGPGVPAAFRERIFEPFFRLPGHAEREGGVGLGLSLVRQIAQRHRGQVRCDPRDGGGSCFVITLPA